MFVRPARLFQRAFRLLPSATGEPSRRRGRRSKGAEVAADVRLERDGQPIESLAWHRAGIYGLAWAGPVLVSGDTQGSVALWDLAERLRAP